MKVAVITVLLCVSAPLWAQASVDSVYRVEVTGTASPMMNFFRAAKVPGTSSEFSLGYGLSMRAMWHPGRLLSVGLLTGYFVVSRDEISAGGSPSHLLYTARLSAVPLQLALSMQKFGFEFGLAIGPYIMMSTIKGGNSVPVRGSRLELGMTFFVSYGFPLTEDLTIGPELRVLSLRYRGIISVMPSVSLRFTTLRY
jgi:hypothetical protein